MSSCCCSRKRTLHAALLACDQSVWQIEPIFPPAGAEDDRVAAGGIRRTRRFRIDLPADARPARRELPLPRETLKLIATTERLDFRAFWLAPMRSAATGSGSILAELVRRAGGGGAARVTRSLGNADPAVEDWTTAEIAYHITTREGGCDMASIIVGWLLIGLGVLSYAWALVAFVRSQRTADATRALPSFSSRDLKAVAELLEKISELLSSFSKLSIPMQWALLGLADIGIGAYLLANRPF